MTPDAKIAWEEGRLADCITAMLDADGLADRLTLAELYLFAGDRPAARKVLRDLDTPDADPRLSDYLADTVRLTDAEDARHTPGVRPAFLGPIPPHAELRLNMLDRVADGDEAGALELFDQAEEATPWVEGHLDGQPFGGVRDGDDRTTGVLEAFIEGVWTWIPLEDIRQLRLEPSDGLRDELYRPGTLETAVGTFGVHLPTLYVNTADEPDDEIRLGRAGDLRELFTDGPMIAVGPKQFTFEADEFTLHEWTMWEGRR